MLGYDFDDEVVPDWLVGLWRRESITLDDGSVDATTTVYWAQSPREFIDIRIPADRPDVGRVGDLSELSPRQMLALANQKGFAGYTELEADLCTWHRQIDFRPSTGRPDTGMVRVEGDTLYEEGDPESVVGAGYREVYRRESGGGRLCAALTREAKNRGREGQIAPAAMLILMDDHFMYARDRTAPLPSAETLKELITQKLAEAPSSAHQLLDCEVSVGHLGTGAAASRIDLSTIPTRERQPLFPAVSARPLTADTIAITGGGLEATWRVLRSNMDVSELAEVLAR